MKLISAMGLAIEKIPMTLSNNNVLQKTIVIFLKFILTTNDYYWINDGTSSISDFIYMI